MIRGEGRWAFAVWSHYPSVMEDANGTPYPKIELHVHLEGTVQPATLLQIAERNGLGLPADNESDLAELYRFRDFEHFIKVWMMTTNVLLESRDYHQITLDYAREARSHGAVYIEGIFSPAERVKRGARWEDMFEGVCDGAAEARETLGVEVRFTPDIPRDLDRNEIEMGEETARWAVRYGDRGVVGIGLGGLEDGFPPEPFAHAFEIARDGGLGSVPHAGEASGLASLRGAIDVLHADRIRHGIRAAEHPELIAELAEREIVLDICPTSNVRTRSVASMAAHPLPDLLEAGVICTISTDDPAMFGTDLANEHAEALRLGATPRGLWDAGLAGALCDDATKASLAAVGESTDWSTD